MSSSVGPGSEQRPAYEGANGIQAAAPGMVDDWGSRDPSAPTPDLAVTWALARIDAQEADVMPQGGYPGNDMPLPPAYTPLD